MREKPPNLLERNAVHLSPKASLNIWRLRQIWRSNPSLQSYLRLALVNQPYDIRPDFRPFLFPRLLVSYLHWYFVYLKKLRRR